MTTVSAIDAVSGVDFSTIHTGWAGITSSRRVVQVANDNATAYLKLTKNYNIAYCFGASKCSKEQAEADIILEHVEIVPGGMKFRVTRNTPALPTVALALLCDGGSLASGYHMDEELIVVHI